MRIMKDVDYGRMAAEASRTVELQDRIAELETQNELLTKQLADSKASETDSYKKLANVLSQLQFHVKLFPEVDGLPEPQITPEDMRPLPNQHSFLTGMRTAHMQTREDVDRWLNQVKARKYATQQMQATQNQQQAAEGKKSLDELAQESFAR